jgi:hypothetical protein
MHVPDCSMLEPIPLHFRFVCCASRGRMQETDLRLASLPINACHSERSETSLFIVL